VHVRVLALLLAVSAALCVVGLSARTALASTDMAGDIVGDMMGLIDDGVPDAHPVIVETSIVVDRPGHGEQVSVVAPLEADDGRLHEIWVFRPPRAAASR